MGIGVNDIEAMLRFLRWARDIVKEDPVYLSTFCGPSFPSWY